ncbi:MAG: NAD(P)-binding domain-containing protein [Sediminibacterium sp.]|nr:MAG: glycerol-3-phosphate dehydrogenase [Chitinophagaceae bacterium]MDP1842422.1 NAD(P)-binding domain-containing protein [Sediminibacterium sp.]TXT33694.1 MAG: glycerol-3-phosphate dehydrogenase (NAD(P)+) [Chitinophagaceae bacterium]
MQFGILGSGSWATAIAKILTDNGNTIHWWIRNSDSIHYIQKRKHNPHYLSGAYFNPVQLLLNDAIEDVIAKSDVLVIAIPSAYVADALAAVPKEAWVGKKIVSAVKGILPLSNKLLNEYMADTVGFSSENYFTLLGPCHAEEVASEKLSYLTFSGNDAAITATIAAHFKTEYINTIVNTDVIGVQYAAVLKNIYALGAGIAHGLEYGDNFLSVYIAASANEMAGFLRKISGNNPKDNGEPQNYAASVYLGDLLVTCYSLYSRNRTFGNMLGKGYSVKAAKLELNMVAEGYNASKCIYKTNSECVQANMPIATTLYSILWENCDAAEGFRKIESFLI